MAKYLGIDYGRKRIGLALAKAGLAEPLAVLANDEHFMAKIAKIAAEEEIDELVVGLSENEMAQETAQFARQLQEELQLPLHFADETLSSYTVEHKLRSAKKKVRSGEIDHFAAAEFLQEWLDTKGE